MDAGLCLKALEKRPTLIYAYGGSNVSSIPVLRPRQSRMAEQRRSIRSGQHSRRWRIWLAWHEAARRGHRHKCFEYRLNEVSGGWLM